MNHFKTPFEVDIEDSLRPHIMNNGDFAPLALKTGNTIQQVGCITFQASNQTVPLPTANKMTLYSA
jgi:hypothetical protein